MRPKKTANYQVVKENGQTGLRPLNRKARRALAKEAGIDWEKAKSFKKLEPKKKTLTGYSSDEDIVEI